MTQNTLWGRRELISPLSHFTYGGCRLWVKHGVNELAIATEYKSDETQIPPSNLDWERWMLDKPVNTVNITPCMPDRSVVISSRNAIHLAPHSKTKLFVDLPIWITLDIYQKPHSRNKLIPTEPLSKTWFGSHIEGDACYGVNANAEQDSSSLVQAQHRAICPIHIINTSNDNLQINKLCLRTQYLDLYLSGEQLWSSETKIFYKGVDSISELIIGVKSPKEAKTAQKICPAQEQHEKALTLRTFSSLKDWYSKTSLKSSFNRLYSQFNGNKS